MSAAAAFSVMELFRSLSVRGSEALRYRATASRNATRFHLSMENDVLLFFGLRDQDTLFRGDHRVRHALRLATAPLRSQILPNRQQFSGYEVSFDLLCRALSRVGMRVHVNNYTLARLNPHFPVGVSGFPHILEGWPLENPAILGPGLYSHPRCNPTLMNEKRFRSYLVKGAWMKDMFGPFYGHDRVSLFFSGMDLEEWPDTSGNAKDIDVLVYDKIRWNRDHLVPLLLQPIVQHLEDLGLRYKVLRYQHYRHAQYRELLARSRAMVFLCEHETQGLACQEALTSNLPVLAWDQGFWLDPERPRWDPNPIRATSVPNFSPDCGERFATVDEFFPMFHRFMFNLERYKPRQWVAANLSLEQSAKTYLTAYRGAL